MDVFHDKCCAYRASGKLNCVLNAFIWFFDRRCPFTDIYSENATDSDGVNRYKNCKHYFYRVIASKKWKSRWTRSAYVCILSRHDSGLWESVIKLVKPIYIGRYEMPFLFMRNCTLCLSAWKPFLTSDPILLYPLIRPPCRIHHRSFINRRFNGRSTRIWYFNYAY